MKIILTGATGVLGFHIMIGYAIANDFQYIKV